MSTVRALGIACLLLGCAVSSGCLSRRLTVRTDPPGALVLLEGREVGYTPVSMDFTYYGPREIKLIKDGYETKTVLQDIDAPFYQHFPLDFFTDNFLLTHATDRREVYYALEPQVVPPEQYLLNNANSLRSQAHLGQ